MEMSLEQQKPPDALAEQRASNKLVKLIRKLRWMGMEEEAERVQMELAQCDPVCGQRARSAARDGLTRLQRGRHRVGDQARNRPPYLASESLLRAVARDKISHQHRDHRETGAG